MNPPSKHQRYLFWLALGTGAMALVMAVLLVLQLTQRQAIEKASALRADSITALSFQFEREFLRFRQELMTAVIGQAPLDAEALDLRYEIFQSRLVLLRDNPSIEVLSERQEYKDILPALDALTTSTDRVMSQNPLQRAALGSLLQEMYRMGPQVQALSVAATSEVSHRLERQEQTMLAQNEQIVWLTLLQFLFLLVAAAALALRQRRQEQEREALESLTEELREAHFRAETANRGKSQFLANMSHELRTPFNGMLGMLSLLETTPVSTQQSDYIRTARSSAQHLLTLLNDILDVSALEAGKMTLRPEPVQLDTLMQDVEALMRPQALHKRLEFSLSIETPLPAWVMADSTRLKQILFNLINNAIKFTEAGHVRVCVRHHPRSDERLGLAFVVEDSGIGMGEQDLSRLFQRFYQVDSSTARKFGGTGLGLEISQNLARMMEGIIGVRSTPGKGTVFTLEVPFTPCTPPRTTNTLEAIDAMGTSLTQSGRAALRVLVAEDHPVNRKFVGILLDKIGCKTTFCENGQLAVDAVTQGTFDIILMDVHMPIMDGLTATRLIRAMPGPMGDIPIVVLTADVMNNAREEAMQAGVNEFATKPVQLAQLRQAMEKCLGAKLPGGKD